MSSRKRNAFRSADQPVLQGKPFDDGMIRERVSTHGECRPLEDPKELQALNMPLELTGVVKEAQVRAVSSVSHSQVD